MLNDAKMDLKWEPKWSYNLKITEKWHVEIDAQVCYFPKGPKNEKERPGSSL